MANFKLALTAGHYRYTAGKRCAKSLDPNETREWVLNARIAEKVEKLLASYDGIEILRTDDRTGDTNVELENRTAAANKWGADFYLSIHHNAGAKLTTAGGITVYVKKNPSAASVEWQKELYNALIAETGLKGDRASPLYRVNLHEVYVPKMPSVLLELGFMDSKTDVPVILTEDYANKCAAAIVSVIVKRAGLKKKAAAEDTELPKKEPVTAKATYRVKNEIIVADPTKARHTGNGIFTIVEQKTVNGVVYGKLKSGAGWVSLAHAERV